MPRHPNCSDAEWAVRQELAAAYRVFDHLGWSESIYNHITLRVPGEDNAFLINPFGMLYSEVCASNLIKIDIDGNKLDDSPYPVNPAGFVQHSYFHRHLPWAHAICHTHTLATMAVCSSKEGLQPTNFYSAIFDGQLGYHDFEGITVRPEEGERLLANLGNKRCIMLRNHGPVVMGETLGEMYLYYWLLQRACEVQLATATMGEAIMVPPEVIAVHQRDMASGRPPGGIGAPDLAAWTRKIDKIDSSWRD